MRILVVSDISSFMKGGVPAETRALTKWLDDRGHTVALASDAPMSECEHLEHYRISIPIQKSLDEELRAALAAFRPDFVHVICMSSLGTLYLARVLRDIPWAITMHSVPPHERKLAALHSSEPLHYGVRALRFLANSMLWRWVFRTGKVPVAIVHSKYVADIVVRYGQSRDRVALIPLSVEAAEASDTLPGQTQAGNQPLLVTVGGFAHTKGQHDVVKALAGLIRRFPTMRYQMIGEIRDTSYVAYLEKLAEELGVREHILLTPNLSSAEKNAALGAAALYVQPSHEEGFCLAYAEAAAIVPRLVGAATGAIAEMSRNDAGARVVPPRNPDAIGSAVLELLETTLPADLLKTRVQRLSQSFSKSSYLDAHERIYTGQPWAQLLAVDLS